MAAFIVIKNKGNFGSPYGTSSRKSGIASGDRIYMLRQGSEDRGLVASGVATGEIFQGEHWDGNGGIANYVPVDWDTTPAVAARVPISDLIDAISDVGWNNLQTCTKVPDAVETQLDELWDNARK